MADEKGSWKRFQRLKFDSKKFSRRARKAETVTTKHAHKFVLTKINSLRSAKQHIITWLVIVGVLITAVAAQTLWYQRAYRTTAWSEGGTYAEAILGPIDTLNPLYSTTPAETSVSKLIFSSLYSYDETGNLLGDIALGTQVTNRGRSYTVTLRDDVIWSDGKKLTSYDVAYTVALMKSPTVRSVQYTTWADIEADALDETTIRFSVPAPYAAFPHALTFPILPKHILSVVSEGALRQNTFSVSPVGSGPFTLRLLQPAPGGKHKIANLSANESYYHGMPKLARFELHAYSDQAGVTRAMQTGEVNAAVDAEYSATFPRSVKSMDYPIGSGVYALLNTTSPLLESKAVRKALQAGTNTDELRSVADNAPELYLPFVAGQLDDARLPKKPTYNMERASRILDNAGWRLVQGSTVRINKAKQPLQLRVITTKNPTYEKVLERLSGQWRSLGIDVQSQVRDTTNVNQDFVQSTLQPRDYDVLLSELVIGADPDVFPYWHSSQATRFGLNYSNYNNGPADDALTSARARSETDLRNVKYAAFAEQWLADAPAIGLFQSVMHYTHGPSVQPMLPPAGAPSIADRYANVLYWSAEQVQVYKTP